MGQAKKFCSLDGDATCAKRLSRASYLLDPTDFVVIRTGMVRMLKTAPESAVWIW